MFFFEWLSVRGLVFMGFYEILRHDGKEYVIKVNEDDSRSVIGLHVGKLLPNDRNLQKYVKPKKAGKYELLLSEDFGEYAGFIHVCQRVREKNLKTLLDSLKKKYSNMKWRD